MYEECGDGDASSDCEHRSHCLGGNSQVHKGPWFGPSRWLVSLVVVVVVTGAHVFLSGKSSFLSEEELGPARDWGSHASAILYRNFWILNFLKTDDARTTSLRENNTAIMRIETCYFCSQPCYPSVCTFFDSLLDSVGFRSFDQLLDCSSTT